MSIRGLSRSLDPGEALPAPGAIKYFRLPDQTILFIQSQILPPHSDGVYQNTP